MHRSIELPESVYARLGEAAAAEGVTPAEWIAERLPDSALLERKAGTDPRRAVRRPRGRNAGGGKERLSERASDVFGDMLEEQRKVGRL